MPIRLLTIPEHLGISVIQKMELSDFANFQESSVASHKLSAKVRTRFVKTPNLYITLYHSTEEISMEFCHKSGIRIHKRPCSFYADLPVRFSPCIFALDDLLTDEFCELIIDFFVRTASFATILIPQDKIICSPETFNRLLEAGNVKEIAHFYRLPASYLKLPAIEKLFVLNGSVDDDSVLLLKNPQIWLNSVGITSYGINWLLLEWMEGKRDIINIEIFLEKEPIDKDIIFDEITYTPVTNAPNEVYIIEKEENHQLTVSLERPFVVINKV